MVCNCDVTHTHKIVSHVYKQNLETTQEPNVQNEKPKEEKVSEAV